MTLTILPGTAFVLFMLNLGTGMASFATESANFLDGLQSANAALGFSSVDQVEPDLAELLPWCGNV